MNDASTRNVTSGSLIGVLAVLALAIAPHVSHLPPWIVLLASGAAAWRLTIELKQWSLPPRYLRSLIAVAAMSGVLFTYRTLNGLEAGTALLSIMAGVKLLETRRVRDLSILLFLSYFLLFASFLYDQSLLRLPYLLATAWLLTAMLLRLQASTFDVKFSRALKATGFMLLQALPLAVLLFVFFPRLPGQFWAVPARGGAITGLSDELSPGDVSELSLSGSIAFHVKFDGDLPPMRELYWRGPVMHDFDGRTWRRVRGRAYPNQLLSTHGTTYSYRLTLEPHNHNWLPALDAPIDWPNTQAFRTFDYQLVTQEPVAALTSFKLQSNTSFGSAEKLSTSLRRADLALPQGKNPRSRALAQALRAQFPDDQRLIHAVLRRFTEQEYFYTLEPPRLEANAIDDFLFNTRRGFCEHFASAFTVLMRAAGIPARVVTGYQGGEINPISGALVVRQSDAHAWSEVWLEDRGWTRVDPTAAVAPARIEKGLSAAMSADEPVPGRLLRQSEFLNRLRNTWDAVNTFWNDRIVQYDSNSQRSIFSFFGIEDAGWQHFGIALTLVLAGSFALMSIYLAWQFRTRQHDPILQIYLQLCRKLERRQLRRAPYEGPRDFLSRAASALPELANDLSEFSKLYLAQRYGPAPLVQELSRMRYLVNRL
jgi:transglutaminase-like putative cysteine protease